MYFSPLNKPVKSENQTAVQYKQPIKIEKPLECLRRFLAALVLGSLRIDDFHTTAPLGHLMFPRRRPVEI